MREKIEVLITEEQLDKRISEIANQINKDFESKDIILVCVLKGGVMFMTDIAKKLKQTVEFEFIDVSSYYGGTESSGKLTINKDLETCIEGKHVILLEDIVDTGRTLSYLIEYLKEKNPASLKLCTLLDKPSRRVVDVNADYIGFTIPDAFIVGYGLDYAQKYRNLPYIGILHLDNE
ncbi:hypoxanthine phosphoribosyltransferase [uncultured Tyzzerella sp.]|uniref:hypoxanthine phosphoribosyltransferase n=1 Tax=uncultured Tyzzerella sp. TaxID=2321398 RepID=UPI002943D8A3|nr:hypoxanthine phosphoribosyltransferase [uncultured Tyzzerella sp.]